MAINAFIIMHVESSETFTGKYQLIKQRGNPGSIHMFLIMGIFHLLPVCFLGSINVVFMYIARQYIFPQLHSVLDPGAPYCDLVLSDDQTVCATSVDFAVVVWAKIMRNIWSSVYQDFDVMLLPECLEVLIGWEGD